MPEHFFAKLFSGMFIGMAPLVSTSSIIAEEKEKDTLRVLIMSNVHPVQYLLGIGSYVFLLCMMGALVFGVCGGYQTTTLLQFLLIMGSGILISIIIGAIIGICAKNQMAATSLTVPVMLVLAFLPMLAMFNETIAKIAKFFYSQQAFLLINNLGIKNPEAENILILTANFLLVAMLFLLSYRKMKLD
ncbi:MAG: ABC transporter permease [Agathobacter sp.]|nr:ABC transporter permease [Agathobacter sp.]